MKPSRHIDGTVGAVHAMLTLVDTVGESSYLMEHQGETEGLERKTSIDDTRRQHELVGVQPGMRILDAGLALVPCRE